MIDDDLVRAHRARGWIRSIRSCAAGHQPDTFFQARETVNPFMPPPGIVQAAMDRFAGLTGRQYSCSNLRPPDAVGSSCWMGSGVEDRAGNRRCPVRAGQKLGVLQVRLYGHSPRSVLAALPGTAQVVAVLEQTRNRGARRAALPRCGDDTRGGRGAWQAAVPAAGRWRTVRLSFEDFNPRWPRRCSTSWRNPEQKMVLLSYKRRRQPPSLEYDAGIDIDPPDVTQAVFYGLGADEHRGCEQEQCEDHRRGCRPECPRLFVYDSQ